MSVAEHDYLERSVPYIAALIERCQATIQPSPAGRVYVDLRNLRFELESEEEFFILHEIFVLRTYDFFLGEPCVVLDIGGNVGIAALYFASRSDVVAVRSYEPFSETCNSFRRNAALNAVGAKIQLVESGVASSNRNQVGFFSAAWKGNSGLNEVPSHLAASSTKQTLNLLDASEVISSLTSEFPGRPLIAKIDCEGAEDEIVGRLVETSQLQNFTMLLIEFHRQGPDKLVKMLESSRFRGNVLQSPLPGAGMIYAAREALIKFDFG